MRLRSLFIGGALLGVVVLAPARASAQSCTYTFSLGIGGGLNGCFGAMIDELGEDAGLISQQWYWTGNFGSTTGATNSPTVGGTQFFDNNCGSSGFPGTFAFCTGAFDKTPVNFTSSSGELVFGLRVPDNTYGTGFYWVFSGSSARNAAPPPQGYQAVLIQLTRNGQDDPGQFLLGWEDKNTGCTSRTATNNNRFAEEDLGNASLLDSYLDNCTAITPGGNSDSDFNDSYIRLSISGTGTIQSVTPEPMTMSLMAIGLVAMGGASLRKRRR